MLTEPELHITTYTGVSGATTIITVEREGEGGVRPRSELRIGVVKG